MASEILGLFTSPEQYRAMQDQQTQRDAIQYAGLTPFQRADVSLYTGGKQLGQAVGSLFGMEDPQLRKITMRQQMISGTNTMNNALPALDFTNPDMLRQASAFALQQNQDPEFAMFLAKKADEVQLNQANIQAKLRERPANVATPIQIAQARAELQDTIARLEADQVANPNDPNIARSLAMAKNTLAGLKGSERQGQIPDSIEIARELALEAGPEGSEAYTTKYRKELRTLTEKKNADKQLEQSRLLTEAGYTPGSPEYITKMRQFVEAEITGTGKGRGNTDIKLTLPGQDKAGVKGVSEFRASVIDTVKPFRNTVTSADQAIQSINDSLKTGNFISFNAARTQLAKALGDGTLSRRDVEQAGGDPSILGGLADTASTMFTGTPTADTQRKIKSTLMAIRKVAREKGSSELAIQRQIAEQSGYDEKQMKIIFNFPEFETKGKAAAPEAGRTNETIPPAIEASITQIPNPSAKAPAPPKKGQKQTRTLKSGKTVTVETE